MGEYISSVEAFKSFMESSVWTDMQNEMDRWINDIHEALESGVSVDMSNSRPQIIELTDKQLHRLQGSAEAVRRFKRLPEVIIDNILDDNRGR